MNALRGRASAFGLAMLVLCCPAIEKAALHSLPEARSVAVCQNDLQTYVPQTRGRCLGPDANVAATALPSA